MSYWKSKKQSNNITNFEFSRYRLWNYFSRHLDAKGKLKDIERFVTKSSFLEYTSHKFNKSQTQIKRLIKEFLKCDINQCEQFQKHKNKNKIPWNKTNQERINVLLDSFKKYSKSSNTKGLNEKDFTVPFTLWDFYPKLKLKVQHLELK